MGDDDMKSVKARLTQFIEQLIKDKQIDSEILSDKIRYVYFKIEGFCDEPEVFIVATDDGLEFGYDAFIVDEPTVPLPIKKVTHTLSWEVVSAFHFDNRKKVIVDEMMKTVAVKKRQYRTCQYCQQKLHRNEFYDKHTCIQCAENIFRKFIMY